MNEILENGPIKYLTAIPLKQIVKTNKHLVYMEIAHYTESGEIINLADICFSRKEAIKIVLKIIKSAFKC